MYIAFFHKSATVDNLWDNVAPILVCDRSLGTNLTLHRVATRWQEGTHSLLYNIWIMYQTYLYVHSLPSQIC